MGFNSHNAGMSDVLPLRVRGGMGLGSIGAKKNVPELLI